jgi:1,4-alpha-glucan branching enzyme
MRKPIERAVADSEIQRVADLRHPDPHAVLGIHLDGDGVVVRAFRPDAEAIHVLPDFGGAIPMVHRRGGVFEARLNGRDELFSYMLEIRYPHNRTFTVKDPYSFLPTLGDLDLHLLGEGRHEQLWERMGAHPVHHGGVHGVAFAVWAPNADSVSTVGDFNSWDGRLHPMRLMGSSGVWELFVPEVGEGARYKFEIRPKHGGTHLLKADPFAFRTETPPLTASVVHDLTHFSWGDHSWLDSRRKADPARAPWSVYEVHPGSWRRVVEEGDRPLTYRELAPALAEHVSRMGFTHVELLPIAEHPFGGSWGYQVSGYYAPTARFGHPDDVRYLVDYLHQRGIGVIVDWVPGHFPRDAHGLARFDGTALFEHEDPRKGAHPDWGTLVFNFGRNEVRNFLIANALFWIEQYHVDGLRVDAVASMLYLDYSRREGEWIPNRFGGRENEEAIAFLRELNDTIRRKHPGVVVIAEESTAWPKVSQPTQEGGLGFHFKWNMGWMHDTLAYFSKDPLYRRYHHHQLTFGLLYAFSESFMLPLSHDEVVHGKGSLLGRMPGDEWQRMANLRALYVWMWAHPGKKLVFMGGEFGQSAEWNHDRSLDWHLLSWRPHQGVATLLSDLNRHYRTERALHELDGDPAGFQWIQADAVDSNVYAFIRRPSGKGRPLVCVANLSPVVQSQYRLGLPEQGPWREILNSDADLYGGSGVGNHGQVSAEGSGWDGQPASAEITLPPLGVLWLMPERHLKSVR